MQHFQTSFFYDLQELIRNSPLLRKYYYLFKALDLSALPDRNYGVGATGHSRHAILRAFIIKHLQGIKTIPGTNRISKFNATTVRDVWL